MKTEEAVAVTIWNRISKRQCFGRMESFLEISLFLSKDRIWPEFQLKVFLNPWDS